MYIQNMKKHRRSTIVDNRVDQKEGIAVSGQNYKEIKLRQQGPLSGAMNYGRSSRRDTKHHFENEVVRSGGKRWILDCMVWIWVSGGKGEGEKLEIQQRREKREGKKREGKKRGKKQRYESPGVAYHSDTQQGVVNSGLFYV